MSDEIDRIKALVFETLKKEFDLEPTPSGTGDRVRASVWIQKRNSLPVATESSPTTLFNFWFLTQDVPAGLPASIKRFDRVWDGEDWAGNEKRDGANHNLKHYRQFRGRPITRIRVTSVQYARFILNAITRKSFTALTDEQLQNRNVFLLKVDGTQSAPGGICRPKTAEDWEGGVLTMDWSGPRPASRSDLQPGQDTKTGDLLYIWTHEDLEHGSGRGMTATAIAGEVEVADGSLDMLLTDVTLINHPFGFKLLGDQFQESIILRLIQKDRSPRAWLMTPSEMDEIDALIGEFGSEAAARKAAAEEAYLDPLDRALIDHREEVEAAEAERQMAIVKARPGQQRFREEAMKRHNGLCVVTRFSIAEVLEAAHVIPHTGHPEFEVPENSLVFRRDIHALFDNHLIGINPKNSRLMVSPRLANTPYAKLADRDVDHKLAPQSLRYQANRFEEVNLLKVSR